MCEVERVRVQMARSCAERVIALCDDYLAEGSVVPPKSFGQRARNALAEAKVYLKGIGVGFWPSTPVAGPIASSVE